MNGDMPAFPQPFARLRGSDPTLEGLTKREYMATQLMAALVSCDAIWEDQDGEEHKWIASEAVAYADDLLKALKTKEGEGSEGV